MVCIHNNGCRQPEPKRLLLAISIIIVNRRKYLFPPKQLDRGDVDNESPGDDGADLRQDFDEASLLGHNQAEAIHNRRHWDKLRYAAQPFWKEECRKECSRQKHHRERNQIRQRS